MGIDRQLNLLQEMQQFFFISTLIWHTIFKIHLGTIHLRRQQIFHDFWPLPPYRRQFFTTIRRQIWQIFDPSPPSKKADILTEAGAYP